MCSVGTPSNLPTSTFITDFHFHLKEENSLTHAMNFCRLLIDNRLIYLVNPNKWIKSIWVSKKEHKTIHCAKIVNEIKIGNRSLVSERNRRF